MTLLTTLLALIGCAGGPEGDSGWRDSAAPVDRDGDGAHAELDCDDSDPARAPGADERCDGLDNDCDGDIDEQATDARLAYEDGDGDGYGDPSGAAPRCALEEGLVWIGEDCDDDDASVNPAQAERCLDDGVDEDCDGLIDTEDPDTPGVVVYQDDDGDGYGDEAHAARRCAVTTGWALAAGDCRDHDASVSPGAPERCDQLQDYDCDSLYGCEDGDCATDIVCVESCDNGVDDEGDGAIDCEDDECWERCEPRVQSNLYGGSADVHFWSGWTTGGKSYTIEATAYSLTGSVQLESGGEVVICDWRVPRVELRARYSETFSSLTHHFGAHEEHEIELSSACPRDDLPVLPPVIGALPGGGVMTGLGDWLVGPITLRSVTTTDGGWWRGETESKGSIPALSPTSARWGGCLLTSAMSGAPCAP